MRKFMFVLIKSIIGLLLIKKKKPSFIYFAAYHCMQQSAHFKMNSSLRKRLHVPVRQTEVEKILPQLSTQLA